VYEEPSQPPAPDEPPPIYTAPPWGAQDSVPPEIQRMVFNTGAFFGGFIWAVGNRAWIGLFDVLSYALLPLMPIWRLLMALRGNEWAWRARKWDSVEQFQRAQKRWGWVGLVLFALQLGAGLALLVKVGPCVIPTSSGHG
jgi:hypothetical protein